MVFNIIMRKLWDIFINIVILVGVFAVTGSLAIGIGIFADKTSWWIPFIVFVLIMVRWADKYNKWTLKYFKERIIYITHPHRLMKIVFWLVFAVGVITVFSFIVPYLPDSI